jgi:hypothetical protein
VPRAPRLLALSTCPYTRMCVHSHTCTLNTHTLTFPHTHNHTPKCASTHTHARTCAHTHHLHIYARVLTCNCTHTCNNAHIHTHKYTLKHTQHAHINSFNILEHTYANSQTRSESHTCNSLIHACTRCTHSHKCSESHVVLWWSPG